ncbi:Protein DA1 [Hibiscus syriacus]|uniref:Protein DA1 n=1 Tax=Hibiscus syriacus TaxID=106335 RepID=A0A6A2XQ90_HIBSY|nr:Protein DA1 [Hibiscus syriacus]
MEVYKLQFSISASLSKREKLCLFSKTERETIGRKPCSDIVNHHRPPSRWLKNPKIPPKHSSKRPKARSKVWSYSLEEALVGPVNRGSFGESPSYVVTHPNNCSVWGGWLFWKARLARIGPELGIVVIGLKIPTNPAGLIEYRAHPFWIQKYCLSHEHDGTPRCCSCERMEPRDTGYVVLDDGRKLCLECLDSAVMDTKGCQPLYLDIQEFYEGVIIICLRLEDSAFLRNKLSALLLTGSILAHEMMHAWMRLQGFQTLNQDVEEGICQVLAHMLLVAQLDSSPSSAVASTSSSDSRGLRKTKRPEFERKLGEFFKHQIESDTSPVHGDGFRAGHSAVYKFGLRRTLEHIRMTGRFPY